MDTLNQATHHWHTGSTRKRTISVFPCHRVYESRVDRFSCGTSVGVEQPILRISVRLAPLQQVFRHCPPCWPSRGVEISFETNKEGEAVENSCCEDPTCARGRRVYWP